jgi:nucleoside-diphosphate-sugar epimerase
MNKSLALVTGAPGWLGTRLTRALAEGLPDVDRFKDSSPGRPIRCLALPGVDTTSLESIKGRVEVSKGDLRRAESLGQFFKDAAGATLFHAAGVVHPSKKTRELFEVNYEGTRNLLGLALQAGVKRFIYVSSNSPFGCNPGQEHVFDESSPYHPYGNYGRSKRLAEDLTNEAGRDGGMETVIIRPPWFYGPDQPPRQTLFFRMIRDGKVPVVGSGENRRSMAYIDNICQGLLLCEDIEAAKGQTYWIADRRPYSMNEIIDTVERVMENDFGIGMSHKRLKLPGFVGNLAVAMDTFIQGLGFYHQKIHVLSEMNMNIACSIDKAVKELGYDPKVELAEGMRRSIKWLIDAGMRFGTQG